MFQIILQVITSWQVIVITIAILIYIMIVNNAAKSYRRPRTSSKKVKTSKQKEAAAVQGSPEEAIAKGDSNEDLGLEEA